MTSLSGSFRIISEKIFASSAMIPFCSMVPVTIVSIPSSMSFVVNLMMLEEASIRMHSKIGMVVLFGTALRAMFTLFDKFDFEQMIFIMWITPFVEKWCSLYINI